MKLPQRRPATKKLSRIQLKGQIKDISVTGLTHHGQGVAKINGKTLFIENALPGEQVDIKIIEDQPQYSLAKVTHWHHYAEDRTQPFCQYYGECGGCDLQHLAYPSQLHWKQQNFINQLESQLDTRKLEVLPMLADEDRHYRRRARLFLTKDSKTKQPLLGFRKARSNQVIDIEQCPILTPELNQAFSKARFNLLPLATRQTKELQLAKAENGVWLTMEGYYEQPASQQPYYTVNNLRLHFDPNGFIQVNEAVNNLLVEQALSWLKLSKKDCLLDLFCGNGNFSIAASKQAGLVVGVEGAASALKHAQNNAQYNNCPNLEFFQADLFQDCQHQAWWNKKYNSIILDPGRMGAKLVCEHLSMLAADQILYISCQSDTLIRDLKLLEQQNYRLVKCQLFDMFPHTQHFETMVLLHKKT
ncbi:TRAM domain-containing protein [Thiomicrospira microaerophila]|uniref:TRAM domain-containing protein n=1 Tax=Thiomicrospira microaerophila TaxID=406020 RepID=UPI00200C4205|nr:TRAM domain-containing protein [Thiomicrospira microaerophila]UQB42609.1 TRAM domain-containing protein [Thiomicrospira microaerophila]